MQKGFLLVGPRKYHYHHVDKDSSSEIVGLILADTMEKAAEILGGELDYFQYWDDEQAREMVVWLPVEQFSELWDGAERKSADVATLRKENRSGRFEQYIWTSPNWGRIPLGCITPHETTNQRGFAIIEILHVLSE